MSTALHEPRLAIPLSEHDHVIGPATAPVELVEYGDYECPYCGAAHGSVKEILRVLGDGVRFAFRNFPLGQIHPHAVQAANAAEAAGAQREFWGMHDLLFENQRHLDTQSLLAYARTLGLDLQRFGADLTQQTYAPRIREDFLSGVRSGVNGTPTFFVNGVRHNGGYDPESLLAAIRDAA
jgi:protein-disulfide isomerase